MCIIYSIPRQKIEICNKDQLRCQYVANIYDLTDSFTTEINIGEIAK